MNLKRVESFKQRDKDLAFGYVHQAQALFFNGKQSTCYDNIPEIIGYLVALFLHLYEYFEYHGPDLQISKDKMSLMFAQQPTDWNRSHTAHGNIRINSKTKWRKCSWTFQIYFVNDEGVHDTRMAIGLVSSKYGPYQDLFGLHLHYLFYLTWSRTSQISLYCNDDYDNNGQPIDICCDLPVDKDFHQRVRDGDIVRLELDLERNMLFLSIDGKQYNEYFRCKMDDGIEYKLGITMTEARVVTIIDFQTYLV